MAFGIQHKCLSKMLLLMYYIITTQGRKKFHRVVSAMKRMCKRTLQEKKLKFKISRI